MASDATLGRRPLDADRVQRSSWSSATLVALGIGIVLLSALFLPEARAAIDVWEQSTAYGHCFLVLPMTLYLLWDRRELVKRCVPRAELGWLPLALPLSAVWMVAERLGIMEGRQLTAIAAFELLFLVVLGWRAVWALSGPLAFLFFLVPFGAFVTPALQEFTTQFTVLGMGLLGIPFYADHFIIDTPAGTFLVAEACAGLRFLIAAIAFGVFYAILSFRSPVRRAAYIALSIVVPIIANGFRALGIVVLGQVLGSAEAAAADHLVYGWIFFSVIMLMLVAIGQAFRDPAPRQQPAQALGAPPRPGRPIAGMACACVLVAAGPIASGWIDRSSVARPLAAPVAWTASPDCSPAASEPAPSATVSRTTLSCGGFSYRVDVITYAARSTMRDLLADRRRQTNELTAEDLTVSAVPQLPGGSGEWTLVQSTDPDGVLAYSVWADGRPASGGLQGRIDQAKRSVMGSDYQPVMILITAAEPGRSASPRRADAIRQIGALISSQADLQARVARASLVGAPG